MEDINCLSYALRFWKKNPLYRIWYNSDHCINIPMWIDAKFTNNNRYERVIIDTLDGYQINSSRYSLGSEFSPIEEYGYSYFISSFRELLSEDDVVLLKEYFEIKD